MNSSIFISRMRFYARHGVAAQERQVGAEFEVSLRVHADIGRALLTDDVADTVSYADLYNLVKREMAQPSQLLEHAAGRIARSVLQRWPETDAVDIELTKLNPPMGAPCSGAGVTLSLTRSDLAATGCGGEDVLAMT